MHLNTQKISQTDHNQSRMRTCIRLSLLALLLAAGLALPRAGWAAPSEEKLTLDGATSNTTGPMAAAVYEPLGLLLIANQGSDRVSVFEIPAMAPVPDPADTMEPLNLTVGDQPVAIAIWDNQSVMNPTPDRAYAFVANFGDNTVSVIDLFADPPVVLPDQEINLVPDADSSSPRPTALAVMGDELFVATDADGTVMRYDITDLPGAAPSHTLFPVAATDRTSAKGNAIVCQEIANVAPGDRPRTLTEFRGFLWAGCTNGGVSQISPSDGNVVLILTSGGPDQAAALVGDPRGATKILYVLDDTVDGIFALDFSNDFTEGPTYINPVCNLGSSPQLTIPVAAGNATAMVPYSDPSDQTDWLVVLSTANTGSFLTLVNVASIDPDPDAQVPECTLDSNDGISFTVPLTLGNPVFPENIPTAGFSQQIGVYLSYIAVPNYAATGGVDMVSMVTDAALLDPSTDDVLAFGYMDMDPDTVEDNETLTQLDLVFDTDELVHESDTFFSVARVKGTLAGVEFSTGTTMATQETLTIPVTSAAIRSALGLSNTANEVLQVLFQLEDDAGDISYVSREIIHDTVPPQTPMMTPVVEVGSNMLTITVPDAKDDDLSETVTPSGIGGYFVHFTEATADDETPDIPDDVFIASNSAKFVLGGLENRVTYKFEIFVRDRAGNQSSGSVTASGRPVPGVSLLELLGENGCVFSPRARGWGVGELLLWLGAFAIVITVRRRGVRA